MKGNALKASYLSDAFRAVTEGCGSRRKTKRCKGSLQKNIYIITANFQNKMW